MFRFKQAFSSNKLEVRVPHARGLPLTDMNQYGEEAESRQWIGVDLDGTLAEADAWQGFDHIGKPVPQMVKRVRIWLELGIPRENCYRQSTKPRVSYSPYLSMVG